MTLCKIYIVNVRSLGDSGWIRGKCNQQYGERIKAMQQQCNIFVVEKEPPLVDCRIYSVPLVIQLYRWLLHVPSMSNAWLQDALRKTFGTWPFEYSKKVIQTCKLLRGIVDHGHISWTLYSIQFLDSYILVSPLYPNLPKSPCYFLIRSLSPSLVCLCENNSRLCYYIATKF